MPQIRTRPRRALLGALVAGLLAVGLLAVVGTGTPGAQAAPAGTPHLPDLRTILPTDSFSIVNGTEGREFRYTHRIYNAGEGPLDIAPFYSTSAGTYLGRQQVMTHDAGGNWSALSTRRVADEFKYHAEHGHFHFPLASFGLYTVTAAGGFGAPVTMSPKVGFCISDSGILPDPAEHNGVGNSWWGGCNDPTSLRGISVGGYDEYDYRDPGQSVPLAGVPNGRYWFRAISDPNNDFVESNEANNEEDVLVTISGNSVTVGEVRYPDTTPCTASLVTPVEGSTRAGRVLLTARTNAGSGAVVSYLVDGRTVGRSRVASSRFAVAWRSASVVDGTHWVAAQVTRANGRRCTSPVASVRVRQGAGHGSAAPLLRFTDPRRGSTVRGRVAIAVSAADPDGVARVSFKVDGHRIGKVDRHPPFSMIWNSRRVAPGRHRISATAVDRLGHAATRAIRVTVRRAPRPLRIHIDGSAVGRGRDTVTTPGLSTSVRGAVLLALVSYDGPAGAAGQAARVAGGGLRWRLVKRSNSQAGVSEIWAAKAARRLRGVRVTATPRAGGYDGMLSVFAFRNASSVGVAAAAGSPSGAPNFYVPAVQEGSWVFAAGNDWDGASARRAVRGQTVRSQWLDTAAGDTFWVQALNRPTTSGRLVTIRDTSPTGHQWNYVGAEVTARH
ncbi:hypothetical protein GCM10009798_30950 [Nocardioides panacihumi]|uniref:Ig-like domain repeat protein n=1 Tax=Nocardioides panacihumi TaxID=400774 RepID=A0ABP5CTA6_9ACTN